MMYWDMLVLQYTVFIIVMEIFNDLTMTSLVHSARTCGKPNAINLHVGNPQPFPVNRGDFVVGITIQCKL